MSGTADSDVGADQTDAKRDWNGIANVTVKFENLTLDVVNVSGEVKKCPPCGKPKTMKRILHGVSGEIMPGDLVALMGASGAGKSTLLNILSGRNSKYTGDVYFNGVPSKQSMILKNDSCFIQQEDMFYGNLTVSEHLHFQSRMRIPLSKEECENRVEAITNLFGLTKCANNKIGNLMQGTKKGISGGEKKRLSVASELLSNPSLIFADEPTSGLDSFMAESIVDVLKDLAFHGHTVIATIHQPSSDVFELFNKVLLLSEGQLVYLGSREGTVAYFMQFGLVCPPFTNPADFLVEILAINPEKRKEKLTEIQGFVDHWKERGGEFNRLWTEKLELEFKEGQSEVDAATRDAEVPIIDDPEKIERFKEATNFRAPVDANGVVLQTGALAVFVTVMRRMVLSVSRDPQIVRMRFIQTMATAILSSFVFFRLQQEDYFSKMGAVFFVEIQLGFQVMGIVALSIVGEKPLMLREKEAGIYSSSLYFLARNITDFPLQIIVPFLFVTICWWMMGLRDSFVDYVMAILFSILTAFAVGVVGYIASAVASSRAVAIALAPMIMIPMFLVNPFYIDKESLAKFWYWLLYISPFTYGWKACMYYVFHDVEFYPDCPTCCDPESPIEACTGNELLLSKDVDPDRLWLYAVALVLIGVLGRLAAGLALWGTSRKKIND